MFHRLYFCRAFVAAMTLMLCLAAAPARAAELESLVGDWAVMIQLPDAPQMASLRVEPAGEGSLVATLISPLGEAAIEDIELDGERHILIYMTDVGGQPMDIEVSLEVAGDAFEGNVIVGGGAMDLPLRGARVGTPAETELQDALASMRAVEEPAVARLAVGDAPDLIGERILKVTTFRGDNYVDFHAKDEDGFVLAEFTLPPPMSVDPIRNIARDGDDYVMKFTLNFGSSVIDMTMRLSPEGDRFVGSLVDANNMFNSEVVLLTTEQAAAEQAQAAAADADGDAAPGSDDPVANRETVALNFGDNEVKIQYSKTRAAGDDYERLETLSTGETLPFTHDFATKLTTAIPLRFAETLIPTDNVAEGYPGVYSLWLERNADGWALRFNNQPDVWGTQHDPAADGPAVPLTLAAAETPAPRFRVALEENGDAGRIVLAWGDKIWTADFTPAH
jgi:hypothetical protein